MARTALSRPEVSYSGPGASESRGGAMRAKLPRPLRRAVYVVGTLLWLSGAVWMLMHYAFPQRSAFGPLPNPWEAPLMRVHGLIAVCGVFLIGWMSAVHVSTQWSKERNRRSGLTLGATAMLLIVSGYALYYTTGSPHDTSGIVHELLGILSPVVALLHWWRNRASI